MPGQATPGVGESGLVGKGDWRTISTGPGGGADVACAGWDCDGSGRAGSSGIQCCGPASTLPRPQNHEAFARDFLRTLAIDVDSTASRDTV
jgi:hypothetical protein